MLVATPLNCTDIDSFAAELLRMFRYMSGIGFKINDMNTMGLVLEPLDPQEEPEPLQVQLERLPCSMEARWEILRRCAAEPFSAAQLAASMNLNSGTVSRNVYGLYKLGYLETRGDGERVNYITRPDALERLFRWVLEYVSEQK